MKPFYLSCLLLFLIKLRNSDENEICPIEVSHVIQNTSVLAKWEALQNGLVISHPACVDAEGKYILRECRDGLWFPKDVNCYNIKYSTKCGKGLLELDNNCVEIMQQQTFDEKCPGNSMKYYNYTKINSNAAFWLPIRQINSRFIYTAMDKLYGVEIKAVTPLNQDCFTKQNRTILSANCTNMNYQLCLHHKQFALRRNDFNEKVQLELKYDRKHESIYLNVYSPQYLMEMFDENDYAIYCFTNAARKELTTPVARRLVYNSMMRKRFISGQALIVYRLNFKYSLPGQYWCEAFDNNQRLIVSNKIVAPKRRNGNEYSLKMTLFDVTSDNESTYIHRIDTFLEDIKFKEIFIDIDLVVRVMEIESDDDNRNELDVVFHLTTFNQAHVVAEYYKLLAYIHLLPKNVTLLWFRSSEYCLPERVNDLSWKLTNIGAQASPRQLCIDSKGLPIRRKCLGDFMKGAYWAKNYKSCTRTGNFSQKTKELFKLANSRNITQHIKNLTQETDDLTPLDLYLVANALHNTSAISNEVNYIDDLAETVSNLMETSLDVLKDAQMFLNATDTILDSIDILLQNKSRQLNSQVLLIRKERFLVQITKPFLSNVSGLAVYKDNQVINMQLNETFEDLSLNALDLSTYVPFELLNSLAASSDERNNITIITTIFFNDKLFNSAKNDLSTLGKVISVRIPNYGIFLEEPIRLLFENEFSNNETKCAYWEYGLNSPQQLGHWSFKGGTHIETNNFSQCVFTHLTHFALLIMSQKLTVNEDDGFFDNYPQFDDHNLALSYITIVGCILSLIGILGIFLTAICFKKWRQKAGTKILLQLAVTISLELIVVHIADSSILPNKILACKVVGISLHYVVLSKFSWMFVSAVLQYIRFVKIFTVLPARLVLKAMIFGWCLPLIPVTLVATLSPDNYSLGAQQFCYPSGLGLYLGLTGPVALIVLANFIAFLLIMKNVFQQHFEHAKTKKSQKLQVYLGILLFFMLGIPWVFGILAEILKHSIFRLIFVYLFCLTATLQGCVIFIFYVILDKETFQLWRNLLLN